MGETFFPYRLDRRWRPMFLAFGVTDDDGVTLVEPSDEHPDGLLRATYGRVRVTTPLINVDHTEISGPHRWWTAVGLRLSFADDGLTMGTNRQAGLCLGFVEPIPKVIGFRPHSALWVSVAEPEALAAAIGR
ncbi:MAG: hypothetical protein AAGA93_14185 [Actinomycetota bacterium]